MKIAYLILAHNNYQHLKKLIVALDNENVTFFLHIDKKSLLPTNLQEFKNVIILQKRVKVYWGAYSQVKATINLLKCSMSHSLKFDYYSLISGVDYPLRNNEFLYDKLREGGEFLNILKGVQDHKPESRFSKFYFRRSNRRNISLKKKSKEGNFLEKIFKKRVPSNLYVGSQWFILSHNCVSYILDFVKKNFMFKLYFSTCLCPDEAFFQTIIGNSPFLKEVRNNLTYTDWSTNPAPAEIAERHVELFQNQISFNGAYGDYEPFFARKFSDESAFLTDQIDIKLRGKDVLIDNNIEQIFPNTLLHSDSNLVKVN